MRYWGHLVPVLLQTGLYWWLRFQPYIVRNDFWYHVHRPYTYRLEFIGTRVSLMVYLLLSLRLLRQHRGWLEENFSEVSRRRRRWLRWLLLLLAVVSGQWLAELVLRASLWVYYRHDFSTELLGVVVFVIGIMGLRQADMRAVHFAPEQDAAPAPAAPAPAEPGSGLRLRGTATIDRTQFGVNFNSASFFQNLLSYAIRNDFLVAFGVVTQ